MTGQGSSLIWFGASRVVSTVEFDKTRDMDAPFHGSAERTHTEGNSTTYGNHSAHHARGGSNHHDCDWFTSLSFSKSATQRIVPQCSLLVRAFDNRGDEACSYRAARRHISCKRGRPSSLLHSNGPKQVAWHSGHTYLLTSDTMSTKAVVYFELVDACIEAQATANTASHTPSS